MNMLGAIGPAMQTAQQYPRIAVLLMIALVYLLRLCRP